MASIRNRVLAFYRSLGISIRVKVTEGVVPKSEYERLSERPGIVTYLLPGHELWVDWSSADKDLFPQTVLVRVHNNRGTPPWIELADKHTVDIPGDSGVTEIVEQVFEDVFGRNLVRVRIDFDSGNIQPVSREFFQRLKQDETVHSACVIRRDYDYIRVNYIDGGSALYLVPIKLDVNLAL